MRVKEYQLDELARARALQDEAAKLHIPVPVLSYQYEIADADGNIEEKGIGKSNSYTRNALNSIAWLAGLCDCAINNIYGDGGAQAGRTDGTAATAHDAYKRYSATTNPLVNLGTSTAEETLNSYLELTSSLTAASSGNVISVFDEPTRKLVTTITRTFVNYTASTINITESGVTMKSESFTVLLYIRDVFTAIPVEPGKSITWTYVTEVAYPEP